MNRNLAHFSKLSKFEPPSEFCGLPAASLTSLHQVGLPSSWARHAAALQWHLLLPRSLHSQRQLFHACSRAICYPHYTCKKTSVISYACMTHTFRSVLLEKFEIIDTGKCYSDSDYVSLPSVLYHSETIHPASLQVFRTPERIAFSEAICQDFTDCRLGAVIAPAWATAWFKVVFHIPAQCSERELHFRWTSGCEAMVWSDKGRAIQGLSEQGLRFVPIDTSSAPCEVTLYVEAAANTLMGNGDGGLIKKPNPDATFSLQRCECATFNRAAYLLLQKFKICAQMAKHLHESDPVSSRALHCATRASCIIQPTCDSTFSEAERALRPALAAQGAPARPKIFACGHCHIDCAW